MAFIGLWRLIPIKWTSKALNLLARAWPIPPRPTSPTVRPLNALPWGSPIFRFARLRAIPRTSLESPIIKYTPSSATESALPEISVGTLAAQIFSFRAAWRSTPSSPAPHCWMSRSRSLSSSNSRVTGHMVGIKTSNPFKLSTSNRPVASKSC